MCHCFRLSDLAPLRKRCPRSRTWPGRARLCHLAGDRTGSSPRLHLPAETQPQRLPFLSNSPKPEILRPLTAPLPGCSQGAEPHPGHPVGLHPRSSPNFGGSLVPRCLLWGGSSGAAAPGDWVLFCSAWPAAVAVYYPGQSAPACRLEARRPRLSLRYGFVSIFTLLIELGGSSWHRPGNVVLQQQLACQGPWGLSRCGHASVHREGRAGKGLFLAVSLM